MSHPASDCYEVFTLVLQFNDLIMHHLRPDAALFAKLNIPVYFILPVLSRLSSNSSMKTGKSTPKEKANPIVRTIHNVEQKQRNHDQMLSCLTDETSPQHEAIFSEDLESIPRVWHLYSVLNIDLENTNFHEYKVFTLLVYQN